MNDLLFIPTGVALPLITYALLIAAANHATATLLQRQSDHLTHQLHTLRQHPHTNRHTLGHDGPMIHNTTIEVVDPHTLTPYPGNARRGDIDAIADSLTTNGQYRPLVVQASTGHVLAGNHTLAAALRLGWDTIAIHRIDVDDDRARRIVLADNRTGDLATYDDRLLAELLTTLDDFDGTGYTHDDLTALENFLQAPDLDDLSDEIGEPNTGDAWPTITLKVPHHVNAAWNAHVKNHNDNPLTAICDLLGIDPDHA